METKLISMAKDFSKYPAGRYIKHGPYTGEAFRENLLIPALKEYEKVQIDLDGVCGYAMSFLDEAFTLNTELKHLASKIEIIGGYSIDRFAIQHILKS